MFNLKAESGECQFSYAVHPAYTGADGVDHPYIIHIVVNDLPDVRERMPMVLIVEFDYMLVNQGGDTPPISIELDALHDGIDLDRVEIKLRGTFHGHSFGIKPLEEKSEPGKGQLRDFRRAA